MPSHKKHLITPLLLLIFFASLWPINTPTADLQRSINVFVDPRMELLAIVQYLSGYELITKFNLSYKQEIWDYFSPYKNHPAVTIFKDMRDKGFSYDAPPTAMLFLSNPPDLNIQFPITDYIIGRAGGKAKLMQFIDALRSFARETQFMTFFKLYEGIYLQFVNDVNNKMTGTDYIGTLENFYGWSQNSYNIILVPLFHTGGYGPRIERAGGTYDIYSIIGPVNVINDFPDFGSAESFKSLALHEFSHSFVNPTTDKFQEQIAKYSMLMNPIRERMEEQAYGTWETCVNEHIVRAITSRFAYYESGWSAGNQEINYHKRQRGFLYIEFLYSRYEYYETQRDIYPTLVDFYPELIDVFRIISENSALFSFSYNN